MLTKLHLWITDLSANAVRVYERDPVTFLFTVLPLVIPAVFIAGLVIHLLFVWDKEDY